MLGIDFQVQTSFDWFEPNQTFLDDYFLWIVMYFVLRHIGYMEFHSIHTYRLLWIIKIIQTTISSNAFYMNIAFIHFNSIQFVFFTKFLCAILIFYFQCQLHSNRNCVTIPLLCYLWNYSFFFFFVSVIEKSSLPRMKLTKYRFQFFARRMADGIVF